ncbi:hypothetical protein PHMEG_0003092 [Phytophthora megakarya]|uniref:ZSWIM1/3 RNaseH-like domain-containing protein n=1 Tax=Phytophthora megakarya TaxID=4795 RepID=A0A225WYV2_9STRA|nr:hypothetical protein PHMEG_0003092 [Phytophthora megakarya]
MRRLFTLFPELLLIDCTHKTNRYDHQLCSIMVMDAFGSVQFVQHTVIETNSDWHMRKTMDHFKEAKSVMSKC